MVAVGHCPGLSHRHRSSLIFAFPWCMGIKHPSNHQAYTVPLSPMLRFFAHKQTPGPARLSSNANEKFGVIFNFTCHRLGSSRALWPLPVRAWREHACSWHQKTQGQPVALLSGGTCPVCTPMGVRAKIVCMRKLATLQCNTRRTVFRYHSIPITLARAAFQPFFWATKLSAPPRGVAWKRLPKAAAKTEKQPRAHFARANPQIFIAERGTYPQQGGSFPRILQRPLTTIST